MAAAIAPREASCRLSAGARTLIVENHAFFGGVAAWALGMGMDQMRPGARPRSAVHERLIRCLAAYGDQACRIGTHRVYANVEYLKVAALDALDEAGARYLVGLRAVDAIVKGGRVVGVVAATKRGLMDVRAKAVADCTGDADVAHFAGAATMTDPEMLMPMTLALSLAHIDTARVEPGDATAAIRGARPRHPRTPSVLIEVQQIAPGTRVERRLVATVRHRPHRRHQGDPIS